MQSKHVRSLIVVTWALLGSFAALAATPAVEIVQSVPVETQLAVPGLRQAKEVWIEMIDGAKKSIDLGQFYVSSAPGEAMEPVLQALERAGQRGVHIRVLLAASMIYQDRPSYDRLTQIKNCAVKSYDISKLTGGIIHSKHWIIDEHTVFVGSQNLDWRALDHIQETGVKVHDIPTAAKLKAIFDLDWSLDSTTQLPIQAPALPPAALLPSDVVLTASPPRLNPQGIQPTLPALLDLMAKAKKSIKIQILSYSPLKGRGYWPDLDNALRAAAVRGVKVHLVVSHWNTAAPGVDHLKSLSLIPNLTVSIATVPEYSRGFIPFARVIHSKFTLVDDEAVMISTSNWSEGYFSASRNIELTFRDKAVAGQIDQIFQTLIAQPYVEKIDPARAYPPPRRE